MTYRWRVLVIGVACVVLACGGDEAEPDPPATPTTSETTTTCEAFCGRVAQLCAPDPSCMTGCSAGVLMQLGDCPGQASSCSQLLACTESTPQEMNHNTPATPQEDDTVCLDYTPRGENCAPGCPERVLLREGVFCSRGCTSASDCAPKEEEMYCINGSCRPRCSPDGRQDEGACRADNWTSCAQSFDGFGFLYYCDNI